MGFFPSQHRLSGGWWWFLEPGNNFGVLPEGKWWINGRLYIFWLENPCCQLTPLKCLISRHNKSSAGFCCSFRLSCAKLLKASDWLIPSQAFPGINIKREGSGCLKWLTSSTWARFGVYFPEAISAGWDRDGLEGYPWGETKIRNNCEKMEKLQKL